jgi:hypothetical protein
MQNLHKITFIYYLLSKPTTVEKISTASSLDITAVQKSKIGNVHIT